MSELERLIIVWLPDQICFGKSWSHILHSISPLPERQAIRSLSIFAISTSGPQNRKHLLGAWLEVDTHWLMTIVFQSSRRLYWFLSCDHFGIWRAISEQLSNIPYVCSARHLHACTLYILYYWSKFRTWNKVSDLHSSSSNIFSVP